MPDRKSVTVEYKSLVVIWLALLMSQALFVVVVCVVSPELCSIDLSQPFLTDRPLIILVFAGSALVFFFLSQVLSRQHVRRAIQDRDASCFQTGLLIGCALAEIPSILGLILALVFHYPYFYLWIAVGIFGILLNFPRKGSLDAATWQG